MKKIFMIVFALICSSCSPENESSRYDKEKERKAMEFFKTNKSYYTSTEEISILDKANLSVEVARFSTETNDGLINSRGIDYDPRDKNFWITDYNGNLYKLAGFDTPQIEIGVKENNGLSHTTNNIIDLKMTNQHFTSIIFH